MDDQVDDRRGRAGDDVPKVAAGQAGVFTRAQAVSEGWTPRQVRRRVTGGRWVAIRERALVAAPATPGHAQRCWAVHLTWSDRVFGHRSAAVLRGWPVADPAGVEILTPRDVFESDGVLARRGPLPTEDVTWLADGLPVTSVDRTMVDCFMTLPVSEGLDLYAWLMSRDLIDRGRLVARLRDNAGRRGVVRLRDLLALTQGGAVSGGEHRLHGLLHEAGVDGWEANARLVLAGATVIPDVWFPAERVAIEVDGLRSHSGREAFVRDRRRQNLMQRHGVLVLRYTWEDLATRPWAVVREICSVLAQRRP